MAGKVKGKKKASKQKKSAKKGTNYSKGTKPQGKQGVPGSIKQKHVTAACSILNPFCVVAKGAKRPDGFGMSTMGIQLRSVYNIGTGATGVCGNMFIPGVTFVGAIANSFASPNYTVNAAWSATVNAGLVTTHAKELRIVSWGVTFRVITSATTSGGYALISSIANPVVGQVIPTGTLTFGETQTVNLSSGKEFSFVGKPIGATAHHFRPLAEFTSTMSNLDWSCCWIELAGASASTNVLLAEVVYNVEFTLSEGSTTSLGSMLPPPKPVNTIAVHTQTAVQAKMPAIVQGGLDKLESTVKNMASTALDDILQGGMAFMAGLGL